VKQVRVHGPADVRLDEVDEPQMGERDAVVGVVACGVCGSDLKYIEMGGVAGPAPEPMSLGHEISGVVEALGTSVTGISVGDRVVVHPGNDQLGRIGNGAPEGGLTPRLLVREAAGGGRLYPVPEGLDLTVAALSEPIAVGMNAVDRADCGPDSKVAIFGCGPIGLAALATLVDRGNDQVVAVDLSVRRLSLALELGAAAALDPGEGELWERLKDIHGAVPFMLGPMAGTDSYIEASGDGSVIGDVLANAKPGARLSVVALHYRDIPVSFLMVLMKQLTIGGAMEYPAHFESAIDLLTRRDLSPLITHRYPLDEFPTALQTLGTSRNCGKVMITIP
jgi:threonine dehydrogenase-like Zn-dependent dehydrogenase